VALRVVQCGVFLIKIAPGRLEFHVRDYSALFIGFRFERQELRAK
jgi:hypothetical protein